MLIEIGTEDLPPALLLNSVAAFSGELGFGLKHKKFVEDEPLPSPFWTPRRIAVKVANVATHQPTETVKRKGPTVAQIDKNDPKIQGFAKSCGVKVSQLEIRDGRLFCHAETGGKSLAEALPELLPAALSQLAVPSRMRWGVGEHTFARPVRWLCVLHGDEVIDYELFGVKSGRVTHGHRHHCPAPLELKSADDYEEVLEQQGHVIADLSERKKIIKDGVVRAKEGLLNEAAATTEWPQVLSGKFAEAFLSLPPEVITQTLEHALKVFPQRDEKEQLLPKFFIVADVESKDPQTIVRGYENVVRARLEDAKFFFDQDKKTSLEDRRPILERTLFQEKLGTLADKAERLKKLAAFLAPHCGASPEHAQRAAQLCKCDLSTDLVGEYPELQGIMGSYYAAADGEDDVVATAIREHYLPQGRADMPTSPAGAALAIADKADTLVGFWFAGLTPSGSKDPYGLRRAANGILRILVHREIDHDIEMLIRMAVAGYENTFNEQQQNSVRQDLRDYLYEQLCGPYICGVLGA